MVAKTFKEVGAHVEDFDVGSRNLGILGNNVVEDGGERRQVHGGVMSGRIVDIDGREKGLLLLLESLGDHGADRDHMAPCLAVYGVLETAKKRSFVDDGNVTDEVRLEERTHDTEVLDLGKVGGDRGENVNGLVAQPGVGMADKVEDFLDCLDHQLLGQQVHSHEGRETIKGTVDDKLFTIKERLENERKDVGLEVGSADATADATDPLVESASELPAVVVEEGDEEGKKELACEFAIKEESELGDIGQEVLLDRGFTIKREKVGGDLGNSVPDVFQLDIVIDLFHGTRSFLASWGER